jgi:RNase P subunit RPR2
MEKKVQHDIVKQLIEYQMKVYKGETMKLSDVKFECKECHIYFTPGELRAKKLMDSKGVINECKECEKGNSDVY